MAAGVLEPGLILSSARQEARLMRRLSSDA
jgi:hypothetical protein